MPVDLIRPLFASVAPAESHKSTGKRTMRNRPVPSSNHLEASVHGQLAGSQTDLASLGFESVDLIASLRISGKIRSSSHRVSCLTTPAANEASTSMRANKNIRYYFRRRIHPHAHASVHTFNYMCAITH